jgi:hypothetical protein
MSGGAIDKQLFRSPNGSRYESCSYYYKPTFSQNLKCSLTIYIRLDQAEQSIIIENIIVIINAHYLINPITGQVLSAVCRRGRFSEQTGICHILAGCFQTYFSPISPIREKLK